MPAEPADNVRPLGFWEATTAINARRCLGASTMVILGEGRGPLDESTFRRAAHLLFNRQEILQCRLSEGDPLPAFVRDVRFEDILITTQPAETEQELVAIWEQLLHEELPDRRRLWEARFAPTNAGDRWRVFFKIHHTVADGRSMSGMLNQFIELAAAVLRGEADAADLVPIAPPAEQRLAKLIDREDWLAAMQAIEDAPLITPWPLDHEADMDKRRSRVAFRTLEPSHAEAIHRTCHDHGTTILGGFAAAIALVHARHWGGRVDTDLMVPMDMRPLYAVPPDAMDLQMAAYAARVFLPNVRVGDDPWSLAARFRHQLEEAMRPEAAPPHNFLAEDVMSSAQEWLDFEGRYRHGFCPTNVGRLPFTGDHPPLVTDRIDMTAAIHFGGFSILAPLLMHKGTLRANFTWIEPLMDDATACSWIDDVWGEFANLA
ncbi:MAG: condensation domain-containing protein [Phycisphaerales bacterium]|nr:condensation domain-containing protein [Phycisphaerales bacterium]